MKKNLAKLSMLLVLVCLLASCFSISALAEGAGGGSQKGILGYVGDAYDWFYENFTPVFTYVYGVVPELADIAEPAIHYAILGAVLLAIAVVLVLIVVSLFKGRFFRALARTVLWCTVIFGVSFLSVLVRQIIEAVKAGNSFSFEDICDAFHVNMAILTAPLYDLAAKAPILVNGELVWLLPLIFLAALVLIIVLSAIVIKSSKKRARRRAAARAAARAAEAEAALAAASEIEALESPEEETPVVAELADAPAADAPAAEEIAEETAETTAPEQESIEEIETSLDEYPTLESPVFMPIPSAIFDIVDFTDPKRDGYSLATGVEGLDASFGMSDELAEELTAVVYDGAKSGPIVKIGVDCLAANFKPYSYINVKILRRLGLVPENASAISVVHHGTVDKPLMVEAADFSPVAVKMLTLAGGRAVRLA